MDIKWKEYFRTAIIIIQYKCLQVGSPLLALHAFRPLGPLGALNPYSPLNPLNPMHIPGMRYNKFSAGKIGHLKYANTLLGASVSISLKILERN